MEILQKQIRNRFDNLHQHDDDELSEEEEGEDEEDEEDGKE